MPIMLIGCSANSSVSQFPNSTIISRYHIPAHIVILFSVRKSRIIDNVIKYSRLGEEYLTFADIREKL